MDGAAVVAAGLLPKRFVVPVGVAVPEAGVDVFPKKDPAGLLAPPNNDPSVVPPAVCPKSEVPVEGAAVAGVVVEPALPNSPPV